MTSTSLTTRCTTPPATRATVSWLACNCCCHRWVRAKRAREDWRALHDAYVASPPSADATHAFLALERLTVDYIARWLSTLRDEGALASGDLDVQARFLNTVVNGLSFERALPGDYERLSFEAHTLRAAADSILQRRT